MNNRFCRQPWSFVEVHQNGDIWNCCPSWITKPIGNILEQSWEEAWNGNIAQEYRQSMIDSTFKNCIETNCPHLLSKTLTKESPVFEKDDLNLLWKKLKVKDNSGPLVVNFCYDRSCNLSCPSCRDEIDMCSPKSKDYKDIEKIHDIVINEIIKDAYRLYITGTGDPFASPFFRNFLQTFDKSKYKNIGMIHLHTNGNLWTEQMWNTMSNVHELVKSVEISIDAGTKETYEKVRRNGDWDILMKNLEYINTIKTLENVKLSFVIQDNNYKEMELFENLKHKLNNIPRVRTHYYKLLDWGVMKNYEEKAVWKSTHKNFTEFKSIWKNFEKTINAENTTHNLLGIL